MVRVVFLLLNVTSIFANELSLSNPAYKELSTPKLVPLSSNEYSPQQGRHGTGTRKKRFSDKKNNKSSTYYSRGWSARSHDHEDDKFGTEDDISVSDSPYGAEEGESN